MRRKLGAGLVVLGMAALSCQVVMGLHEPVGNDPLAPPPSDAGSDVVDPCSHASPPAAPLKDDDTVTKNTIWFATERVTLPLKPDAGIQPGFDLDNGCTCETDLHEGGAPCTTPSTSNPIACDYPNGIDDAFGKVASGIPDYADLDPTIPANASLASGARTLLLYLTDYNDKANDSDVSVQFVSSGGLYSPAGCDESDAGNPITFADPALFDPPLPAPRRAPRNDGCDHWSPNLATTNGSYPNRKPNSTLAAYVSDYTVVFKFKDLSGDVFGTSTTISNGIAVAKISKDANGKHHAEGIFAGRLPFGGLVDIVGRSPYALPDSGSIPFCDSPFWPLATGIACGARDTMVSPSQDFTGQTCDGTSLQIGFRLVEARVSDAEFTSKITGGDCSDKVPTCQ